ncbi:MULTISPECIES: GSU2403 family nucleotidyltransferase fold protein [Microbacterium]|uniref:Nucleotidyltransferase-like domain-containing protein n=1 Tax=Microbacterium hominis TaxID=162426 RepID=A0A2K9DAH7_9MICO|nr:MULTISPECIES: GSU2403 family nucleotidyltransferase fold protein [Microbacterium]AUG30590.1 hypothetical protein CXR34_14705 [Microbacterium hominis]
MPAAGNVSPEYVAARRVLLDALEALGPHLDAIVLVGAQAVYVHAPLGDPRPTYTTDADLALDPELLGTHPDIARSLADAGFAPNTTGNPGSWVSVDGVVVDLMVPLGAMPLSSRRTAPLEGHGPLTARRTRGLELALFDNAPVALTALEPQDSRAIEVRVAGPAALVIAKAIKIQERVEGAREDRVTSKDAGDLLRLLRNVSAESIGASLRDLEVTHPIVQPVVSEAVDWLGGQLTGRSPLIDLAVADRSGIEAPAQVTVAMQQLTRRMLDAYRDADG